jgi:hypothetical protein
MLRPQELAVALACNVKHIHALVECGKLRGLDISTVPGRRCLRIPAQAWRDFLARQVP